jgi:serine/threonine protein kinase
VTQRDIRTTVSQEANPVEPRGQPTVQGYEILGELGRGSMGVVYKARQVRLDRLVALKMILAGGHAGEAELARFRREAEAVAQLQHPGIVQIYEVGEQDGLPYIALEFVAGGSLAAKLAGTPLPPEQAAALLELLARAVHAAHERGIIHRDLKPGNVLLAGEPGRVSAGWFAPDQSPPGADATGLAHLIPKIADFGLARRVEVGHALTATGAVLGTPSYMAPEQAAGEGKRVGPAADVYALGAVLYECLTGRPPFQGPTPLDTLLLVVSTEPVPPRRLQPKVPRDLETICLKGLHKEPAKRYASAAALADDLARFQRGEAIQARPVGRLERGWRWCRRNPALAAALAAVLLALVLGTAVSTWQAAAARQAERRAEASFRQARQAVDDFAARAVEQLRDVPGAHAARQEMLRTALNYYRTFLDDRKGDPRLRQEIASTLFQLANVTSEIGSKAEARTLYQESLAIREQLAAADPTNSDLQNGLAALCNNLANLEADLGSPAEARRLHQRALALREELARSHPDSKTFQANLAVSCSNLASYVPPPEVLPLFQRAIAIREELLRLYPDDEDLQSELAETYNNVGEYHRLDGRPAEALPAYQKGVDLLVRLTRARPAHLTFQRTLGYLYNNMAAAHHRGGARAEALRNFQNSREIRARLVRENPMVATYHRDLARTLNNISILHREQGQLDAARGPAQEACDLLEACLRDHPADVEIQAELVRDARNRARLFVDLGQYPEALRGYRRACEVAENLVVQQPTNAAFQAELAGSWNNLAATYLVAGEPAEALEPCHKARALREKLVHDHPDNAGYRKTLAGTLENQGQALLRLGRGEEAAAAYQTAVAQLRIVGPKSMDLAEALFGLGRALLQQKMYAEAEPAARECLVICAEKLRDGWSHFAAQSVLGGSLLGQKKYAEAKPLLLQSYEGLKQREAKIPANHKQVLTDTLERLVELYEAWGKPEQAEAWRKQLPSHKEDRPRP